MSALGLTIQSTESTAGNTVATSAGDTAGTTTTTIVTGPTDGICDVTITIWWKDTPTYPNYWRPFRVSNSLKVPKGTFETPYQVKAANANWQRALTLGPYRLNGDSESIVMNKESADTNFLYEVKQENLG